MRTTIFNIDPIAKPRITAMGKFSKRAQRYYKFAEDLRILAANKLFELPARFEILFVVRMAGSWSRKKKMKMNGQPHQQKPDIDNFLKSVMDALCSEDGFIYDVRVSNVGELTVGL